ncbi:hypothetical protein AVEN_85499-1 [Araneus ventricosus]|uniref:Reverse transcriptase domain-containing protein n=1 Tax=Araneus ventricosus TaxID=182803 RepID=A0A4Y2GV70_ARAVE|nr:hypothetical protein AVEN_85499-1 [Araneus ventricosus]
MHDVKPRFNPKEDDISLFLVLFERQGKIMNIPAENHVAQIISLLPPDIVQLIAREPEEDAKKYELKRCKELALDKMLEMQSKRKVWYDRKSNKREFSEGDLVLVVSTGKSNKLAVECKMMADILHGCDHFAVPYFDDVAIYSNSWEEHLSHLNAVKSKIKDAGLTIKPIKCKFAHDRVNYLGYIKIPW